MQTLEQAKGAEVEKLLAEIQEALVGARPMPDDRFSSRIRSLEQDVERLDVSALIADLVGEPKHPDVSSGFLDLTLDEPGREASLRTWEELGRERIDALFLWMKEHATTTAWWSRGIPLPLHADTLSRLRSVAPEVVPIGAIADGWAKNGAATTPRREHVWRWLALGHGVGVTMPPLGQIIERLVARLRAFDLLPLAHQVQVMRLPRRSSMVVPVRVPGRSILTLPTSTPTPLTLQYVVHELGHLAENALRPARASLRDRWSFDPVRSEGIALLFELALRTTPGWIEALGPSADDAAHIRRFLVEEERFTSSLIAATVRLGDRMPFASIDDGLEAARTLATALDVEWSPHLMLFRLPNLAYWRAIAVGSSWAESAASTLRERFGDRWANDPRAWSRVRDAIATIAPAGETLSLLRR